jgi:hypothetical protein
MRIFIFAGGRWLNCVWRGSSCFLYPKNMFCNALWKITVDVSLHWNTSFFKQFFRCFWELFLASVQQSVLKSNGRSEMMQNVARLFGHVFHIKSCDNRVCFKTASFWIHLRHALWFLQKSIDRWPQGGQRWMMIQPKFVSRWIFYWQSSQNGHF